MAENIDSVLSKIQDNIKKKRYYPLPKEESDLIRAYYESRLVIPAEGDEKIRFYTKVGRHIANGYIRVVIGDYGPYIEFEKRQLNMKIIKPRWAGEPNRPVKYIWLEVKDSTNTKVYEQRDTVKYADYKAGYYYVDPHDLLIAPAYRN